jgi:hypothetical protein
MPKAQFLRGTPGELEALASADRIATSYDPVWTGTAGAPAPASRIDYHSDFVRLLNRIPRAAWQSFSIEQLELLSRASVPVRSKHLIDYRVSIPFFGKRFYLTVLFGRERRDYARLIAEGQLTFSRIYMAYYSLAMGIAAVVAVVSIVVLYLIKCTFGIDLIDGTSVFHDYVYQ